MEAGGPFPGAEEFAVGSVTATPAEADVASVVADVPSMGVDVASVAVDAPSVAAGVPSVAVDVPSMAVDMPSVEADMAAVEAEALSMVVGAGRFRHNSKLSRPTAFAVGRFVGRHWLRLLERFSPDTKQRRRARKSAGSRNPANRQLPERLRGRTQSQAVRCSKDLVAAGAYADIVRQVHPTHRAGGINQEFGGPRNVNRFGAAPNVQEIIKADGLLLGVRKEWEG